MSLEVIKRDEWDGEAAIGLEKRRGANEGLWYGIDSRRVNTKTEEQGGVFAKLFASKHHDHTCPVVLT